MTTLFISDLHLQPERPDVIQAFNQFLTKIAPQASNLYILGDFFEFWIGDDFVNPLSEGIAQALNALSSSGVKIYFMAGNRDFLIGQDYLKKAGAELLEDPTVINLYGTKTLLLHGDTLCTEDKAYQAFRAQVRNPMFQQQFLAKTVEERIAYAKQARSESAQHTQSASEYIMDVTPEEVTRQLEAHAVLQLIHGHTHRSKIHQHPTQNGEATRIVLGDWNTQTSYLRVDATGYELINKPLADGF
ncbi:MAG: UDP-2,3-diacylglucosamine diphosphatase [Kangiellaceae bacterium]|nr:UDP-2,3-diacylglucosamine diphosphatase [Kangiellaceae bacterium]|tara:strand:+ start:7102 stop:7836 length:735 start_codon:yes stop_codon:yes gene_type:complete